MRHETLRYLLIVDVDGTINMMGARFDAAKVPTIAPMANARQILEKFKQNGAKIVYLTGRSEKDFKHITETWLLRHNFPDPQSVVFFQPKHGDWTWEAYFRFKQVEVEQLARQHPGYVPVIIDDNDDILARLRKAGFDAFKVKQTNDWNDFDLRYSKGAVPSQLDDFLPVHSNS
jgi:acid phosphatase class B